MTDSNEEILEKSGPQIRLDLREETLNKTIWSLAYPAILGQVMYSVVFISDTFMVGWLKDEKALAATSLIGVFMWVMNAPFHAMSAAAGSLVSRYWGEHKHDVARNYAGQTMLLAAAITACLAFLTIPFAGHIIRLLGADPEVVVPGAKYLRVILYSTILGLPMITATGIIQGVGDMRTPMILIALMNAINVVVSLFLAFGFGLIEPIGLLGIAWGTVIARSIGGILSILVLFFSKKGVRIRISDVVGFDRITSLRIWRLAFPEMFGRMLNSAADLAFMRIVAILGSTALAAHKIALVVESLAFMPPLGLSYAVSTVVGQAIGRGRFVVAELTVKRALLWSGLSMFAFGCIFLVITSYAMEIFGATPEILSVASVCIRISILEIPFLAFTNILAGSLRGAGDTKSPVVAMLVGVFIFRLSAVYLLAIVFKMGMSGVWLGTALDWAARSVVLWIIFRKGLWKTVHEREKAKYGETPGRPSE